MGKVVLKSECIYGQCRMVNLCKREYCVGAGLKEDGFIIENGEVKKIKDAKE